MISPFPAPSSEGITRLHDQLKKLQEPRGFFFNKDKQTTRDLLEQLLVLKGKYGYMACPCRLANGVYEEDRDIVCPCRYRDQDVAEFGACYCGLYVSEDWNAGKIPHLVVPERRPPENIHM